MKVICEMMTILLLSFCLEYSLSVEQAIYCRMPSIFGRAKRKSIEGNTPITCLNILQDKCIQLLDYGAEALYYCDDVALQKLLSENLYHRTIYSYIGHSPAIPHQKRLESCNLYCVLGYSCTFKGTIVCYFSPFTRGAMIVNKQVC